MNCPTCGRFMQQGGYYSNDHDDSWTPTWRCSQSHDKQISSAYLTHGSTVRCPGCDLDPVGYAPHNGKGDCSLIHADGIDRD